MCERMCERVCECMCAHVCVCVRVREQRPAFMPNPPAWLLTSETLTRPSWKEQSLALWVHMCRYLHQWQGKEPFTHERHLHRYRGRKPEDTVQIPGIFWTFLNEA